MTPKQILSLGPELADYLDQFSDCFGRSEPRTHLSDYVRGQLSDLPRKSVEPIALFIGIAPRTLQEFLNSDEWDHDKLRDRTQQIVASKHADPEAIGTIDDSGHPKKGEKTACVHRQYCGNTGKIDNCVVTVHLGYASYDTSFRTMLDSTPYLPKDWSGDRARCRAAGIPDDVVYRPKYVIALEQLDRAHANGVEFGWINADEWYAAKPAFLAGLEHRQLRYVVEIPRNLMGWLYHPGANPSHAGRPVEHLARYSRPMIGQEWIRFHVKDTEKGPMVWEAKAAAQLWLRRNDQIHGPYWLIYACNVLDPKEEKYFLSNASPKTPLETILHVAFARWPIERCFEDKKTELGMSHFEVRKYQALCRHFFITQVSHLFLAEQTQRLRKKKSEDHAVPGPHRGERSDRRIAIKSGGSPQAD
jgi:SRSO17 transposase